MRLARKPIPIKRKINQKINWDMEIDNTNFIIGVTTIITHGLIHKVSNSPLTRQLCGVCLWPTELRQWWTVTYGPRIGVQRKKHSYSFHNAGSSNYFNDSLVSPLFLGRCSVNEVFLVVNYHVTWVLSTSCAGSSNSYMVLKCLAEAILPTIHIGSLLHNHSSSLKQLPNRFIILAPNEMQDGKELVDWALSKLLPHANIQQWNIDISITIIIITE